MIIPFKRFGRETTSSSSSGRAPLKKRSLGEDLLLSPNPSSLGGAGGYSGSSSSSRHVVVVMDAMKEFSQGPLEWALQNVIASGSTVTLLGVMPWLNLPLSCKTRLDVWTLDLEDLAAVKERSEWKTDIKYQKVRGIIELCDKYGVVPHMKVVMGYPLRLVVLEEITSLHATWVVLDRHHRKNRSFYKKRIPSNVVMMNSKGEVDMLKVRPMMENYGVSDSPASLLPAIVPNPKVIISDKLLGMLRQKDQQNVTDIEHHLLN